MNRRALFIAVLVGMLGAFLMVLYQRRFEVEASGGEKVKLLIALKRIERGKPITEETISIREIPLAYVDDRAIRETEKNKVLGLKVGNSVKEGQLLLWSDLTATDAKKDLSSLVLPGYRAVSVKIARDDTSIALVKPGDYVTVPLEEDPEVERLTPEQRNRFIGELEERMREAARKFEFEKAAQLRDRVKALRQPG